ncbi:MAG: aromatic ring-hydroxylating oxygenase subunit alpha [Geminicoccales bacterium]
MNDVIKDRPWDEALEAALQRTMRPIEEAHGLPNRCYTDPDLYELEKREIFGASWCAVGFGKDIPNPGDVMPVDYLGTPLLLARRRDGSVKVLHNVCSHRGMILVEQPANIRSVIRCPYHSWCYNLNGELKATPHVGGPGHNADPSIDRSLLGLKEARSALWFDVVFVDLSGSAPAFESVIEPLARRWCDFDQSVLCHAGPDISFKFEIGCNWKLAVENYCESYHLPWIHPGLNSYSRLEDHENIVELGSFAGQLTHVYAPRLSEDHRCFPDFPHLSEAWRSRADYVALFPNVLLGIHRDHYFAIRLEPISHDRTIEHVEIYVTDPKALGDDMADLRLKLKAMWQEVFTEDLFVVEGMQRGRASPGFEGGVFSPAMDEATHAFHQWVAMRLSREAGDHTAFPVRLDEAV